MTCTATHLKQTFHLQTDIDECVSEYESCLMADRLTFQRVQHTEHTLILCKPYAIQYKVSSFLYYMATWISLEPIT